MSSFDEDSALDVAGDQARVRAQEGALMLEVARGEASAFETLTNLHLKALTALAQRILGNPSDADEVAQEAFLRLWKYAPSWDPAGAASVKTWLRRVVVNLCVDRRRRKPWVALDAAGELEDESENAFDQTAREDRRRLVQSLLQDLPERQRTAIVLAYFEELSGADVAATMKLSEGAVESLLVRARRHLRDGMKRAGLIRGETI